MPSSRRKSEHTEVLRLRACTTHPWYVLSSRCPSQFLQRTSSVMSHYSSIKRYLAETYLLTDISFEDLADVGCWFCTIKYKSIQGALRSLCEREKRRPPLHGPPFDKDLQVTDNICTFRKTCSLACKSLSQCAFLVKKESTITSI